MVNQIRGGTERYVCCERALEKTGNVRFDIYLQETCSQSAYNGNRKVHVVLDETAASLRQQCLGVCGNVNFCAANRRNRPEHTVGLGSFFVTGCAPGLWKARAGPGSSLGVQRLRSPA